MRNEILSNLNSPGQLEKLYRTNKPGFRTAFDTLYPQLRGNPLAEGWYQRLNYVQEEAFWGTPGERVFVIAASLLAALLAQLPKILSLNEAFFYTRNVGFIVLPLLIAYFARKNRTSRKTAAWLAGGILFAIIFTNALPHNALSRNHPADTLVLACIHVPLWLWSLLGFTFGGGKPNDGINWLGFLRYNGELAVVIALLLIAGGLTTALTINLFRLSGWQIETFYFNYVVISGLAAVPVIATFLTQTQPVLVNKVAPVIASLFSPVALVMLVVYLAATLFSGKDPYHDRDFLLIFNALLIGVMALIFFSVSGNTPAGRNPAQLLILFLLSAVTVVVNGIALSAVLFRITEWGITPNRAAVLGANGLMLVHLLYLGIRLFGAMTRQTDLALVGRSMAFFLPVYSAWSAIVAFGFPLLFGFK